jgi:hypothetical protein
MSAACDSTGRKKFRENGQVEPATPDSDGVVSRQFDLGHLAGLAAQQWFGLGTPLANRLRARFIKSV